MVLDTRSVDDTAPGAYSSMVRSRGRQKAQTQTKPVERLGALRAAPLSYVRGAVSVTRSQRRDVARGGGVVADLHGSVGQSREERWHDRRAHREDAVSEERRPQ